MFSQATALPTQIGDATWLINYMTAIGIQDVDSNGVCFGRGMTAVIAMIQKQLRNNDALHQGVYLCHRYGQPKTPQHVAHLKTIQLFQTPSKHPFLPDAPLHHTQSTGLQPILDYLASGASHEYVQLNTKIHPFNAFTGAYSKASLKDYLSTLAQAIDEFPALPYDALPLLLSTPEHSATLGYDGNSKTWSITDTTSRPTRYFSSVDTVRDCLWDIFTAFYKTDRLAFSTHYFSDDVHFNAVKNIIAAWQANPTCIQIHKVDATLSQDDKDRWLLIAAKEGDEKNIDELIKQGANVNYCDKHSNTPLLSAATNHRTSIINKLATAPGIQIDAVTGPDKVTALWNATSCGWLETVDALIKYGANANFTRPSDNETPLITASRRGLTEVAIRLIPESNLSLTNKSGHSALYYAAIYGRVDIVRALLAAGADPEQKASDKATPLSAAKYYLTNPLTYHTPKMMPDLQQSIVLIEAHLAEQQRLKAAAMSSVAATSRARQFQAQTHARSPFATKIKCLFEPRARK